MNLRAIAKNVTLTPILFDREWVWMVDEFSEDPVMIGKTEIFPNLKADTIKELLVKNSRRSEKTDKICDNILRSMRPLSIIILNPIDVINISKSMEEK